MILLYFVIGFFAAVVAAAPPGAANIVVVKTSIKQTLSKAFYIIVGAGIGELALSLFALHCTMSLTDFFEENPWLQISIFILFIVFGIYFLLRDRLDILVSNFNVEELKIPKFFKGLLLAIINPPVLIFWVLAFTLIHKHILKVSDMSPWLTLVVFFAGVFFGKTTTLYAYSVWGEKMEKNSKNTKKTIHLVIGIALLLLGIFQGIRFFII